MSSCVKYELEYILKVSPQLLYQYISTPSGLGQWFADKVSVVGDIFTFIWEDSQEKAKLVRKKEDEMLRFKWNKNSGEPEHYFEMKIIVDEITQDVSLLITDFAKDEDEMREAKLIWESQVAYLKNALGCN